MPGFDIARENMVECQIRTNKVTNHALIEGLKTLPREKFVPKAKQKFAYVDESLEIGEGRYLLEPMVLARLIQAADVKSEDIVLDVGCGSGYSVALLSTLASTVVAIDNDKKLADTAEKRLREMEICNVAVMVSDLKDGYNEQAPYDVIFFNGAVAEVPDEITDQLAENGKLVAVVSPKGGMGSAVLIKRENGVLSRQYLFDASVPYLPGMEPAKGFTF